MRLILTRGLPASGKSTWAKEQVELGNGKIKRVNKDDLRQMIDNRKWSREREEAIVKARNVLVQTFLELGYDVIVDDTNFEEKHVRTMQKLATIFSAEFEIKDFYVPVSEAIRRDALREKPVGLKVIRDMWLRYVCQPTPEKVIGLPSVILCDIDGTIAHMDGRSPYDWHKVGTDKPDRAVIDILTTYSTIDPEDPKIILFSGRDGVCENETREWLGRHGVSYDELFMRTPDDNRKDYIIKRELYEQHIKGKYNVLFVLDDRTQVVDQWRELGLKCLQVAPGDF